MTFLEGGVNTGACKPGKHCNDDIVNLTALA